MTDDELAVAAICFRYAIRREKELGNRRLAYYTSSETALRIIQNKTFWLRNPRLMNDYQEVVHGIECIQNALTDNDITAAADRTINQIFANVFDQIVERWVETRELYNSTHGFIACLSEIDADDSRGMLSMWRAYGGSNGVAMILSPSILQSDTEFLNTFCSPVLYGEVDDIKAEIEGILTELHISRSAVEAAGQAFLVDRLVRALEFAMLSIKHVGFVEEREWRMIHRFNGLSDYLSYEGRVVRGNAEVVCEIDLSSEESLAPDKLFEKIIVGPCQFPENTAEALRCAFVNRGMGVPSIAISDIPLRHM